jgi:hypothetical protein
MNAVIQTQETPQRAARRIMRAAIRGDFTSEALHVYRDAQGKPVFWRCRARLPAGKTKVIRPFHWNGAEYVIGEPPAPATGKTLYRLPELLAAPASEVIVITAGELKADRLAGLGMSAVTSGSASSAGSADWTPLRNRSCLIWPDFDEPGRKYGNEVTAKLRALDCKVEVIDVASLNLPEHGDVVDWLAANPGATRDDVLKLPRLPAESRESQESQPEPLRRPTPPSEPYPVDELGPILGAAAKAIHAVIQAPQAVCGSSLLAAASLAVQGLADIHIDGRVVPLTLWMLTIAESGERKSAVDAEAMRGAREVERELHAAYVDELSAFTAETEQWDAKRAAAKQGAAKTKGEGLARALQDIGRAPDAPLKPTLIAGDFTAEGLTKLLRDGRPSIGAFTDEAGLVFGGHGMQKETVTRTAATLSKAWDRGEFDRIRAAEGATKLYGRRLALHLLAQPVIAERALSDDVLAGQGFLARCLLAWPEGTAGKRLYVPASVRDDPALAQFTARTRDLLRRPFPLADGTRNELAPRALTLTAEAKAVWIKVHDAIERAEAPGGRYAVCKAWASKSAEQCARVAGVLTLIEEPDAQRIEAATIGRAAELTLWHLNEAVRLAGTAELSPEVRDAEAILGWCHATGRAVIYSADALRKGPNRIRERERFMSAMIALEQAGWAHAIEGGAVIDGRHRRFAWRIVPADTGSES